MLLLLLLLEHLKLYISRAGLSFSPVSLFLFCVVDGIFVGFSLCCCLLWSALAPARPFVSVLCTFAHFHFSFVLIHRRSSLYPLLPLHKWEKKWTGEKNIIIFCSETRFGTHPSKNSKIHLLHITSNIIITRISLRLFDDMHNPDFVVELQ